MSAATVSSSPKTPSKSPSKASSSRLGAHGGRVAAGVALVVLLVAMALSTKVVPKGSTLGQGPAAFNPTAYGTKTFPQQQQFIAGKAADAATLSKAVDKDATSAGKQYGVPVNSGASTLVPVKFTGVVGKVPAAGYTPITVKGLAGGVKVNAQLGPAIVGTDLRDATGKIQLGQFENQIQFQNAATAINDQLKKVLAKAGSPNLEGKTVTVTGVFPLTNPKLWNVTPSNLEVTS